MWLNLSISLTGSQMRINFQLQNHWFERGTDRIQCLKLPKTLFPQILVLIPFLKTFKKCAEPTTSAACIIIFDVFITFRRPIEPNSLIKSSKSHQFYQGKMLKIIFQRKQTVYAQELMTFITFYRAIGFYWLSKVDRNIKNHDGSTGSSRFRTFFKSFQKWNQDQNLRI